MGYLSRTGYYRRQKPKIRRTKHKTGKQDNASTKNKNAIVFERGENYSFATSFPQELSSPGNKETTRLKGGWTRPSWTDTRNLLEVVNHSGWQKAIWNAGDVSTAL